MKKQVPSIRFAYGILFSIWYLLSLLPFRILYLISDLLYFPLCYCIRYRQRIIRKNLSESFPDKSPQELRKIEKDFYRFFCDYIVETLKLFTISKKSMMRHMTFSGSEQLREEVKTRNCILYLGHYCNWEWISSIPLHLEQEGKDPTFVPGQIYHALENKAFDALFLRLRSRFGSHNIEMMTALRRLVQYRMEGKRFIVGFISDQAPNWNHIHLWTNFLNHKSAIFTGAERIAKSTDAVVYYVDVVRVKRGHYHARFVKMADNPREYSDYRLTELYAELLEKSIRRNPQYWLWSHNRWKRTYEEFLRRQKS